MAAAAPPEGLRGDEVEPASGAPHGWGGGVVSPPHTARPLRPPRADDDAAPARAAVRASTAALLGEAAGHRAALAALRERDPRFYAFLAQQDAQLLAFDDSDGEGEAAGAGGAGGGGGGGALAAAAAVAGEATGAGLAPRQRARPAAPPAPPAAAAAEDDGSVLTTARARAWCAAAQPGCSLAAAARLLRAFRACAHVGDEPGDEGASAEAAGAPGGGGPRLRVASSAAFNAVVSHALARGDALLFSLLAPPTARMGPDDEVGPAAWLGAPAASPRWRSVQPLARSFLGNALHLLDASTEPAMAAALLGSLARCGPLLPAVGPRLARLAAKAALARFADGAPGERLAALRLLRALAMVLEPEARRGRGHQKRAGRMGQPHL